MDAGYRASMAAGRMGRRSISPPQFGQMPPSGPSAQSAQNVHSKLHIRAFALSGGRSQSQFSQFGRSSSIQPSVTSRKIPLRQMRREICGVERLAGGGAHEVVEAKQATDAAEGNYKAMSATAVRATKVKRVA